MVRKVEFSASWSTPPPPGEGGMPGRVSGHPIILQGEMAVTRASLNGQRSAKTGVGFTQGFISLQYFWT